MKTQPNPTNKKESKMYDSQVCAAPALVRNGTGICQRIIYVTIDESTGRETVRLEFSRGGMKLDQVKKDESFLLPVLMEFMQKAKADA